MRRPVEEGSSITASACLRQPGPACLLRGPSWSRPCARRGSWSTSAWRQRLPERFRRRAPARLPCGPSAFRPCAPCGSWSTWCRPWRRGCLRRPASGCLPCAPFAFPPCARHGSSGPTRRKRLHRRRKRRWTARRQQRRPAGTERSSSSSAISWLCGMRERTYRTYQRSQAALDDEPSSSRVACGGFGTAASEATHDNVRSPQRLTLEMLLARKALRRCRTERAAQKGDEPYPSRWKQGAQYWCGFAGGRFWRVKRRSDTRLRSVAIGTVAHQGLPKEAAQPLADPSGCSGGEGRRYAFVSLCRPGRTCQVRGKGKPLGDAWPKWFGRYLRIPLAPFHAEGCAGVQGRTTAHA